MPNTKSTIAIISALTLTVGALAGCATAPPSSAYVGNDGTRYNPTYFPVYAGQAVSYEARDQFMRPTQANPDPLKLDGNYIGRLDLISGKGECPNGRESVMVVGDNMVTYAYSPSDVFMLPIAADGSIHGSTGGFALDGSIDRDHLVMTIAGESCTSRFAGHAVLNKS